MISALFVETNGCYFNDERIDPWDIKRDARSFSGDGPVILHPPCQLWGNLAFVNYKRWGGEHNKPGNDGGNFKFALDTLRRCGGVLEHPQRSHAFKKYGIKRPTKGLGWQRDGDIWVTEVWQSAYGHRARKATWLVYHGEKDPPDLKWVFNPGTHQVGMPRSGGNNKPSLSSREAAATPYEFKEELVKLAYWSAK